MSPAAPVVWIFGPPGAGKSSLAAALARAAGFLVLDEDDQGGPDPDRLAEAELAAAARAAELNRQGRPVALARTSPRQKEREAALASLDSPLPVFLECPLELRLNRDSSGLYQKALAGEIRKLPGFNAPFDPPPARALCLDSGREDIQTCLGRILAALGRPETGRAGEAAASDDQMILERLADLGYI